MPERCFIWSCQSSGKLPNIYYFRFGSRKELWLEALGIPDKDIGSRNLLCSKHFDASDVVFPDSEHGRVRLKPKAGRKYVSTKKNFRKKPHRMISALLPKAVPKHFIIKRKSTDILSSEPPKKKVARKHHDMLEQEQPSTSMNKQPSNNYEAEVVHIPKHMKEQLSSSTDSAGLKHTPKRNRRLIKKIHTYSTTIEKVSDKLKTQNSRIKLLTYQHKVEKQKIKRLRKKVGHLNDVVQDIKRKDLLSPGACSILEKSFSGVSLALMKRMLTNSRRGKVGRQKYDATLRSFAMTLQFYSSKAYEYVRKTFNLSLPSQRVIRSWLSNISCEPGFSQPAFDSLIEKVLENKNKGYSTLCSLMLDEMSIKKHVDFVGERSWGYVDFGSNLKFDDLTDQASEVLVLMLVALNGQWKLPIAFFLAKSLNGAEKANIVREALKMVHECDVIVTSLTSDGPSANFTMMSELGAKFKDLNNIQPYFLHPVDATKIFIVFDACHMMKLIRNNWAVLNKFVDPDGGIVDFKYITLLHQLQEQEGLRLGTKLKKAHMEWEKQKMKVNLAVQTLSDSVASAIEFLMVDIKDQRFADAAATIRFIRLVDKVFDLCNSRTPMTVRMKMPIRIQNEDLWLPVFEDAIHYFLNCKDLQGEPLVSTTKKTPFLGFILTIKSIIGIYEAHIKSADAKLKYLLTYKLSQDHLELFYCSIRSRNGWNNNPSALQFCRSYKRLSLHHDIKNMNGNCVAQDSTNVLYTTHSNRTTIPLDSTDIHIIRKYSLEVEESYLHDHDYSMPINPSLSDISTNVVAYVTGYAIKMAIKLIKCPTCIEALQSHDTNKGDYLSLLLRKKWGNLIVPSDDSIKVCTLVESKLRNVLSVTENKILREPQFLNYFISSVYGEIMHRPLFLDIDDHNKEFLILSENHKTRIIKSLCVSYLKIRLFNLAKSQSYEIKGDLIRKKSSKLVLFSHQ